MAYDCGSADPISKIFGRIGGHAWKRPTDIWIIDPEPRIAYRYAEAALEEVLTGELTVPGTPIRVVSVLAPGQSVVLSTPQPAGAVEISRNGDSLFVRKAKAVSN